MAIARTPSNAATCCCFGPVTSDDNTAPVRKDRSHATAPDERPRPGYADLSGSITARASGPDVEIGITRTSAVLARQHPPRYRCGGQSSHRLQGVADQPLGTAGRVGRAFAEPMGHDHRRRPRSSTVAINAFRQRTWL